MNGTWNNILLRVPTVWYGGDSGDSSSSDLSWGSQQQQQQHLSGLRSRMTEFHVQNHLFRDLRSNSRYEVIVQSRNAFGWSEPTKSFIFTTRLRGGTRYSNVCLLF